MNHFIDSVYIKFVGNHPRLPINSENIKHLKNESIAKNNDITIGCTLSNLPQFVHLTLSFIPNSYMNEYAENILKNIDIFNSLCGVKLTAKCLSKFCSKLVVVYDTDDKSVFTKILEECYPKYNATNHHFHISIPMKYDYDDKKYIPTWKNITDNELFFWQSYIKTLRFVNVKFITKN